jgi:uncharacterized protein
MWGVVSGEARNHPPHTAFTTGNPKGPGNLRGIKYYKEVYLIGKISFYTLIKHRELRHMASKFELKKTKSGKFNFNLKAANGQVILTSELYEAKSSALDGIESVKKNAAVDTRFERKTSSKNEPYFTLKAGNGQVIGMSEMYSSTSSMENGINSVKTNAPGAGVEDLTEK